MRPFVVIPCHNEETEIEAACASLGFDASGAPAGAELVLVDNGSDDGTAAAMRRVRERCASDVVHLAVEMERGHVPARRAGLREVAARVRERGADASDALVIQADADTRYSVGYVAAMAEASRRYGRGTMLEGRTAAPPDFVASHPAYASLCEEADAAVSHLLAPGPLDVIVDDKACAFRLADYETWGGFAREYVDGVEVLAETTRLFLRAKASGGTKVGVDGTLAHPSRRRIIEHPALHFATCGYPHGPAWEKAWREANPALDGFEALRRPVARLRGLVRLRWAHAIVLFGVLPAWVAASLGDSPPEASAGVLRPLVASLPPLERHVFLTTPGRVLGTALRLIETHETWLPDLPARFVERRV